MPNMDISFSGDSFVLRTIDGGATYALRLAETVAHLRTVESFQDLVPIS
jgi:hypothetical protein